MSTNGGISVLDSIPEILHGAEPIRLETHRSVSEPGAFHPSMTVTSFGPLPFSVGGAGPLLKENARVTTTSAYVDIEVPDPDARR